MKFHHINESEDDPFADPNPADLKAHLAKLEAQMKRLIHSSVFFDGPNNEFAETLQQILSEPISVDYCSQYSDLHYRWTIIGSWQVSPALLAEPSLKYFIDELRSYAAMSNVRVNLAQQIDDISIKLMTSGRNMSG